MPNKLTCIAIDDEFIALKIITSLIEQTGFLDLLGSYQDAREGMSAIIEHEPDIVFLDIQMPEISGMDIIKSLNKRPEIILVTSQEKYAVEAFKFDVTDYLVKPIESFPRFLQSVEKAKRNLETIETDISQSDSIFIKVDKLLTKLNFEDMLFLQAHGDYVKVHAKDKMHIVYAKIGTMEAKLPKDKFFRIHRSYIVQIKAIDNIDQNSIEIGGKIVPMSAKNKQQLLERIPLLKNPDQEK